MKYFYLLFLACALPARADEIPPHSLFMSEQEAHEAEMLAEKLQPASGDIHLGAVMYYGPEDWSVWLQGEKWGPTTKRDDLQIVDVAEDHVRLSWVDADEGTIRDITLKPNESYQIATGRIIASR